MIHTTMVLLPMTDRNRRLFLRRSLVAGQTALVGALLPTAQGVFAATAPTVAAQRQLAFSHLHTGEHTALVYAAGSQYIPAALQHLNHFLRDHYSGVVGSMDPRLFDLLFRVRRELGSRAEFNVISGYRSPKTNETLRTTRAGGVAKRSLHMEGRAIDIRLPGVSLTDLRDAAIGLKGGGVGFYPGENFVHVDTGRVRRW